MRAGAERGCPGRRPRSGLGRMSLVSMRAWPSCHCATVAALPDRGGQEWLVAARYAGTAERRPADAVPSAPWSERDGWSGARVLVDTAGQAEGNPLLGVSPAGVLWLFFVTPDEPRWRIERLQRMCSLDGGLSWSEPAGKPGRLGVAQPVPRSWLDVVRSRQGARAQPQPRCGCDGVVRADGSWALVCNAAPWTRPACAGTGRVFVSGRGRCGVRWVARAAYPRAQEYSSVARTPGLVGLSGRRAGSWDGCVGALAEVWGEAPWRLRLRGTRWIACPCLGS